MNKPQAVDNGNSKALIRKSKHGSVSKGQGYFDLLKRTATLISEARRLSARSVNAVMTATYWFIGRYIVEFEQGGTDRAEYGSEILLRLSQDLSRQFGRGFSYPNLNKFRQFYLAYPASHILSTVSRESSSNVGHGSISPTLSAKSSPSSIGQTLSAEFDPRSVATHFMLPWSAYVRLLSVQNEHARRFYEAEALRGGWSVRQLDRQINSQFYERTALSRNKAAMLGTVKK